MNLEQIIARAEAESKYLSDKDYINICIASLADSPAVNGILQAFREGIDKSNLEARITKTGSFGYYDLEPIVTIEKPGKPTVFYHNVTYEIASDIVNHYLSGNNPKPELVLCTKGGGAIAGIPDISELPLFNLQNRIALRNCGFIAPENINDYILLGKGFTGLSRVLHSSQQDIIQDLKTSGLRGRGGAGYLTADKWQICRETEGSMKYVVCDAVDADPRAQTARLLLQGDPCSVLEGLLISAFAVGACHGYICINSDYINEIEKLRNVLEQMRDYGLLGENILDSGYACDVEIKEVESSLVSGEETALLKALEKKQMMPHLRITYPAVKGLDDKPTLVNNIETMSSISAIFQNGPESVSGIGTEKSKGTKIITLCGEIANKCTVEVPFGMTLHKIIVDIGGGVSEGKVIKAVQFGGPTGAYFAGDSLDIPVSYETMEETGSIIGSGTIEVFDKNSCAVKMARDIMSYLQSQSCGKCVFCREGTYQMLDILSDIAENRARPEDLDLLVALGEAMKTGSICGLGHTAPLPVLSSLKLFRSDYESHIREKRCGVNNSR